MKPWSRLRALLAPRWLTHSIRNKLLAMALLPLLVVLPLLVGALVIWGNAAYDRLLITKVRSDLAVARGYFEQVLAEVGSGTPWHGWSPGNCWRWRPISHRASTSR